MPIYEYCCQVCQHEFELLQKISDEPAKTCPACGKNEAKRLVSASRFQLKGTGWYETDFKDKPKQKNATKESKSNAGSDSGKTSEGSSGASSSDTSTSQSKESAAS